MCDIQRPSMQEERFWQTEAESHFVFLAYVVDIFFFLLNSRRKRMEG